MINSIAAPVVNLVASSYPCVKKFTHENLNETIVLFTSPDSGVCISTYDNSEDEYVGEYCDDWKESLFVEVDDEIALATDLDNREYPCIKKFTRFVVLFTNPACGVFIHKTCKHDLAYPVGEYREDWTEHNYKVTTDLYKISNALLTEANENRPGMINDYFHSAID